MISTATNQVRARWMIVDGAFNHEWLIEVFYLPSYSLKFKPDERLSADRNQALGPKVQVGTKAKLHAAANDGCKSSLPIAIGAEATSRTLSSMTRLEDFIVPDQ